MIHARPLVGWTICLVVALAAALWVLPARWAMAWIPASSPITVVDASGSLWSAQARLAVGVPGLRRSLPGVAHWRFSLAGGPALLLEHPWLRGPLRLGVGWGGVTVSAQSLQLPATALTTVHAMFNALDLGGEVLLEWPEMVLGPQGLAVSGAEPVWLRWGNVSSALSRVRPLGDYTLSARQVDRNGWTLDLQTVQGPLLLKGQGMVAADKPPRFDGRAWADPQAPRETRDALQALLQALGPPSATDQGVTLRVH